MGGATTIEATESVTIPAYTDKEITVIPQGVQGIDFGTVTVSGSHAATIEIEHSLGAAPSDVLILNNDFYNRTGKVYASFNEKTIATPNDGIQMNENIIRVEKDKTKIVLNTVYAGSVVMGYFKGTYYWFAIA